MAKGKKNEENNIEKQVTEQVIEKEPENIIPSEEKKEIKQKSKYLMFKADIPYTLVPANNNSVAGFIKAGSVCKVQEEINNGDLGSFWKIEKNKYINKDWNIEERYY